MFLFSGTTLFSFLCWLCSFLYSTEIYLIKKIKQWDLQVRPDLLSKMCSELNLRIQEMK